MLCFINKRKSLKVNNALKYLVVKFAVLLRIIFVLYCFILIHSHRGFLFFAVRAVHCTLKDLLFKYISSKYQGSCNYFPILFTKIQGKRKEKKILQILRSCGKKKLQMLMKCKSCGKKKLETVNNEIVAGRKICESCKILLATFIRDNFCL